MIKINDVKKLAPGVNYFCSSDEVIAPPIDAETEKMVYVVVNGYTAGFLLLTADERSAVENLLKFGSPTPPEVVSLSPDSPMLIGDGNDEIVLSVRGLPSKTVTINVLTGETASTISVTLDEDGNAEQAFSCETAPCVIVFSAGDVSCKVRAL